MCDANQGRGPRYSFTEGDLHSYCDKQIPPSYVDAVVGWLQEHHNSKGRVLDIGAGAATMSQSLLDAGYSDVAMIDVSPEGLLASADTNQVWKVVADANQLPFASNIFSLVHMKDVLVHIANREIFFQSVSRVLSINGLFALSSANSNFDGDGYFRTNRHVIVDQLTDAGFEVLHNSPYRPRASEYENDWYDWRNLLISRWIIICRFS